jgi:hypothetical protein
VSKVAVVEGVSVTNGDSCKEAVEGKRTSIALWRYEFMLFPREKWGEAKAAKNDIDIYQALEFRKGSDMPVECREGLSEKERSAI